MSFTIDQGVKSSNKRVVWKVFDKQNGKIVSLFQAFEYPKGKLVERSEGPTECGSIGTLTSAHGLYFFTSKERAVAGARGWDNAYIAKFAVSPKDFLYMSDTGDEVTYERATRVGNFIRIKYGLQRRS